jgi:hypothetical protein
MNHSSIGQCINGLMDSHRNFSEYIAVDGKWRFVTVLWIHGTPNHTQ